MFHVSCNCRARFEAATTQLNQPLRCPDCGREIVCVSAEALDDDAAAADFDAGILVAAGPTRKAQLMALGGCAALVAGSGTGNPIVLAGEGVADEHFKLVRVDSAPSRWQIEDLSGGGVLVNGQKIASHELKSGDTIELGEYELLYQVAAATTGPMPDELDDAPGAAPNRAGEPVAAEAEKRPPRIETNGPLCPSCDRRLGHGAKICVDCGIRVPSGRPLMISQGLDENTVHGNAEAAIRLMSWFVWITPLPIPLASSAYGKFKPLVIWVIAAITVIASIWSLSAKSDASAGVKGLMLWPMHPNYAKIVDRRMEELKRENKTGETYQNFSRDLDYSEKRLLDEEDRKARAHPFHPWQIITHAVFHDPGSVPWFTLQLIGNLLFLIVFGARVNAIIGNVATAVIYPLLAAASGVAFLLAVPDDRMTSLSGASGAISGLAGMYFVLLPAHYVYCAVWGRFFQSFAMKVFALRGFWILLIYFAFDALMIALTGQDQATQWAHISGFVIGFLIGAALLMSRRFNCRNGDLLSVILGKHAWPLIGKPSRWAAIR